MMKILITTGIYPPAIGGPATHIAQVAGLLGRRGHEVAVLTLADGDAAPVPGVTRIARGRFTPWRMLRTTAAIVRAGRGCDVVYVQGLWIEGAAANLVLRRPLVRKIVGDWAWERAYGRGWVDDLFDEFQRRRHGGRVGSLKALRALVTRGADRVIVPSEYLKTCVLGWGVHESRIDVIPNAIEPGGQETIAAPRQPSRVVAVGRLTRWKGFEQIISAVAGLPEARLAIVGEGPERARLERLAQADGVCGRVEFLGRQPRTAVMTQLSSASAFVLNSAYEGFPHVLLEAFEAGTPVVAANTGGIGEIVRDNDNGLLVPQGDAAAIAGALRRVFDDSVLAARIAASGRRTLDRYTQESMLERIEGTLVRAAGGAWPAVAAV